MRRKINGPGAMRSRSISFKAAVVTTAALAAFSWILPTTSASAQPSKGITPIGSFDRPNGGQSTGANGNVILDAGLRRGFQAHVVDDTTIKEFDLDTHQLTGRMLTIDPMQPAQPSGGPLEWLWTLDASNHRLLAMTVGFKGRLEDYRLVVIDLVSFTASDPIEMWPLTDRIPLAISYHPGADRIYVMTKALVQDLYLGTSRFFLDERKVDGTQMWEHRLNACSTATDERYAPSLARSIINPSFIYLDCYGYGGVQGQVVRVELGSDGVPLMDDAVFPAIPGPLSTMFDAGSDRMFFLTTNSGAGRGAWVFDGVRESFLGVIATGDARAGAGDYSMGLDQVTGRIYMQSPAGFVVADARRTPLPAGLLYREFAGAGFGSIQVDPLSHVLYVPDPSTDNASGQPQRFLLLRDSIPVSGDPLLGDPDALTTDVDENAGVTGSNVSGGSRAFAFRSLTTGGIQKAIWNVALPYFTQEDLPAGWNAVTTLPIEQGNRDLFLGRVRSVGLTNDSADAMAISLDGDEATRHDAKSLSLQWPSEAAECHDQDATPADQTSAQSIATCDSKAFSAFASAGASPVTAATGTISVRAMYAVGSVQRDPQRGIVSRAESVVRDINLLNKVSIGELRTIAETSAKGRKGGARSIFERTISDLKIDMDGDGVFEESERVCMVCDPTTTSNAITKAIAGKATVTFPEPDGAFWPNGSAGGYQSIIEKQRFQAYSEKALNDDDETEVPGMEVIVYSDAGAGRSRQVFQLAGVQAESHYGIYLLPTNENDPSLGLNDVFTSFSGTSAAFVEDAGEAFSPLASQAEPAHSVFDKIIKRVVAGWRLFTSQPIEAAMMAAMLGFLLLPVYMIQRRRFVGAEG